METQSSSSADAGGSAPGLDALECAFPPCHRLPKPKTPGSPGGPPKYCDDPSHTPLTALRWRRKHGESEAGPAATVPDDLSALPHTSAVAEAQTTEKSLKALLTALLDRLPAHLQALEAAGDPELMSLQIANAETQAQLTVTQVRAELGTERTARREAEGKRDEFQRLLEEATEAATEADDLREMAVNQAEEAAGQAGAGLVLAVLTVRAQQAAEQQARDEIAAAQQAAAEAIRAAEEDAKNRIQAAVDQAAELVEQASEREKTATQAAADRVTEIERQTAERIAGIEGDATVRIATATRKAEIAAEDLQRVKTNADEQATEATTERRRLIDDHVKDRERLIKEHGKDLDRVQAELQQTRDRMVEDLKQARKYATDQTALLTRTERARAIAQKGLEERELQLIQLRARLEQAEREDSNAVSGEQAAPSGGVPEGQVPGQVELLDERARPVGDVSQPGDTAGQDRSAGED